MATPATAAAALAELLEGNARFVAGTRVHPNQDADRRASLAGAQTPFAVVFGCSDSRLAAEIIFDRGLGDLFVVRTAGHTVGAEVLGSIEYAVTVLHTPLVVVLGHSSCGAVQAARDALHTGITPSGQVRAIVDGIIPSVRLAGAERSEVDQIVDVHIQHTVDRLREALSGQGSVVGMSYQLADGKVSVITESA